MAWSVDEVRTYTYTGAVQNETLDPGTYKFECWGAQGGGAVGGKGGYCVGEYTSIGENISIYVGQQPTTQTGGWNGGGGANGGFGQTAGGGASDVRIGGTALVNRVIVGAGGGGRGSRDTRANGHGGGLTGVAAEEDLATPGTGGTQSEGGMYGGVLGQGGVLSEAGGGGGGYYGGGAGRQAYAGGGGGSSFYGTLANALTTAGVNTGHGAVKITMISGGGPTPTTPSRRSAQFI